MADGTVSGAHVPEPVAYVRDLLSELEVTWSLCGGWSIDAWLGAQTRDHGDVDIAIFHDDQGALLEYFPELTLVGHDPNVPGATTEPWTGRWLDLPAHIHVPTAESDLAVSTTRRYSPVEFELLLDERSGDEWVLRREPRIVLPVECYAEPSPWGLPTAAPEAVLFFKAGGQLEALEENTERGALRAHDEQDLDAMLPVLGRHRRSWLRDALAAVHPRHPWLARLTP